ncbi:MAG TPA: protein kinase, partial [Blastocatellia bacterium]|nr:protein kinase [Blastocatellia bacterium]
DGSQYVAMEYVDGAPITEYCDSHKLNITERLKLFRTVCAAVEYAHQNLIVHRDLKPGNIFVTHAANGNAGTVKLLDFGIAKLLDPELRTTDLTQTGLYLLTPEYASPEQMNGQKITTASDVYSLGVVLYELLTGHRPQQVSRPTLSELACAVAEIEPENPSLAIRRIVSEPDEDGMIRVLHSPESVSAPREGSPDKLRRRLQGDLDNIALKALRKTPAERYESVAQFSEDIERHLTRQPVLAQPPTLAYRTGKFVRRNKVETAFAAFAMLVVLAALVFTIQRWRANAERKLETYAARLNLAVQDREKFNVEGIRETVESYLPKHQSQQGEEDLRGFEWYYLWRWSNRNLMTLPHKDVESAVFTQDGTIAITNNHKSKDGTVNFWNAETGRLLSALPYGLGLSQSVLCRDQTGLVVQKIGKQEFKIWQPVTGKQFASIKHALSPITDCEVRPDSSGLFTISEDGTIAAWELATGKLLYTLKTAGPVTTFGVIPKHKRLIIGVGNNRVEFWDMATQRLISAFDEPIQPNMAITEKMDNGVYLRAGERLLKVRDWRTGRELSSFELDQPFGGSVTLQDKRFFTFDASSEVGITDLLTGRRIAELKGHRELVYHLGLSPDGAMAATASADHTLRLWNLQTYQQLAVIPAHEREVTSANFSDDGRKLISTGRDHTAKTWDVASLLVADTLEGHTDHILSVAFSPDSRRLATAGRDRRIKLWEAETGKLLHTLTGHGHDIFNLAFSPDGNRLASASEDLTVRIWDVNKGEQLAEVNDFTRRPRAVAFSPDGRLLAVGCDYRDKFRPVDERLIRILDAATYRELAVFKGHTDDVVSLDFSPDGKTLASASWDNTIKLWEVATTRELATLRGHSDRVWSVRFSPDGKRLASGSTDRSVKLWDVAMGRELATKKTHTDEVFSVAFSPDGKRLASGSNDYTIKLWDATTLRELVTFKDHQDQVFSVAFSPDGRMLASGSFDKTARIFRAATEAEVRARIGK